jgi:DNA repair protein RecO (recombination protein O)
MRNRSSEGIVLSRKNYGEADRLITLLTKHFGKITLISKGVRKIKSRKRGHLEVFAKVKFSSSFGNSSIGILTEVESIDNYNIIRNDLKKVSLAYYFCEVVSKMIENDHKQEDVYKLLDEFLKKMEDTRNHKKLRTDFIDKLLVNLGFWPTGKILPNPDEFLSQILEKNINSVRVGKKVLE